MTKSFLRKRKIGQWVFYVSPFTGEITRGRICDVNSAHTAICWGCDRIPNPYPYDHKHIWLDITFSCSTQDL